MPYRLTIRLKDADQVDLQRAKIAAHGLLSSLLRDSLHLIQEQAKENLSGIPYVYQGREHSIQKRTGRAAASVQVQYPYGGAYRGRIYASAHSVYPGHEPVDYLAVLEYGRGEIRPQQTPSMLAGRPERARLTVPTRSSSGQYLIHGVNQFRGASGYYRFVSRIPPMPGKGWMAAAAETALPQIEQMVGEKLEAVLNNHHGGGL